jgi:predicted dehydrogenase
MNDKKQLSRRGFLRKAGTATAGAVAFPCIIPSSALGLNGQTAPSNRITIGSIATGSQARGVLGGALQQKDTQSIAVCDVNRRNLAKGKAMVDKFYGNEDCTPYHDFRDLLARDDIDAVIIAPPDHWHAIPSVMAANAGKDIYCEKPLTHGLAEGRAVVNATKRNGVVFQVGSMQRSGSNFKQACELVRNGYIGKVKHINVGLPNGGHQAMVTEYPEVPDYLDYDFYLGPAQWVPYHPKRLDWDWRWWMDFGGSQMMDWIGHHGDIAHMGMGWDQTGPRKIEPIDWTLPKRSNLYDAPHQYEFKSTYADGITMTVASESRMPKEFTQISGGGTQWLGEDGQWVWVNRGGIRTNPGNLANAKIGGNDFRFRTQRNHMRDWLDCIKTRTQPIADVEAGHRSASIGHLGKIACTLGQSLEWDPEAELFTNSTMANNMLLRPYRGEWTL